MSNVKEPPYLKHSITKDDYNKITKVFSVLEADPQSYDFLEPVDFVGLNLTDYPTVITHPMDLGTVKKNLQNNQYPTFQEFLADIDLIWANCRKYNMAGSEICKMATHCEKLFKKQMDKQFKNYSSKNASTVKTEKENSDSNLTMDEKMNLTDKIRVLSNEGLTQVVKLIQKECPKGIENIDSEKLQIKIDLIDHKTYELLLQTIDNCMKQNSSPTGSNADK